jgi:hypothetical protein
MAQSQECCYSFGYSGDWKPVVPEEKPETELKRLRREQNKSRQDEIFGGFSPTERAEFEARAKRIHTLEKEIQTSAPTLPKLISQFP